MSDFTGLWTIFDSQSYLDNDLLLMAGIPDMAQAIAAATQFLEGNPELSRGQIITVIGVKNTEAHVIVMTDAHAVSIQPLDSESLGILPGYIESFVKSAAESKAIKTGSSKKTKMKAGKRLKERPAIVAKR